MNNTIDVSIIIPIYNGEKFIKKSVESIINQNMENIEIVLVDDGSTDSSGFICDELSKKYSFINVVHQLNQGPPSARNKGISVSRGKYVSFLDVDDYVDDDTYKTIIEIIHTLSPDCIDFGWKYISRSNEISYNHHQLQKNILLDKQVIHDKILPPLLNLELDKKYFIYDFACNKVFKKQIINDNNILFDENRRTWEDRVFLVYFLKYANTYYSINQCFYNYVDVPNSLSRRYDLQFFDLIIDNYNKYLNWFKDEYDFNTEYVNEYWSKSIENMIFRSLEQKDNQKIIYHNIINALSNEIVRGWFLNRKKDSEYKKEIDLYIMNFEYKKALNLYKKINRKKLLKNCYNNFKLKCYRIIKK